MLWALPLSARSSLQTAPSVERSTPQADTLRYSITAGEPLIVQLPSEVRGRETSYRLLRGPALSWLVDRSFFWRTLRTENGMMHVLIEQRASGMDSNTLVLAIQVGQ